MKSIVKYESTLPMSAIRDQRYPLSSAFKFEFAPPSRTPTAAFSCEYCGKEFNLKQYLICHVIEIHGDTCTPVKPEPYYIQSVSSESTKHSLHEKSYSSSINADITDSNSSMSVPRNMESCSVEKVQKSNITQECVTGNKIPNEHMIVDSEAKQFTCEICQKNYSHESSLKTHLRIHSGVNMYYSCDLCQKSFNYKGNLKKHLR
eukprot:558410_1